jgi:hypothetical protein
LQGSFSSATSSSTEEVSATEEACSLIKRELDEEALRSSFLSGACVAGFRPRVGKWPLVLRLEVRTPATFADKFTDGMLSEARFLTGLIGVVCFLFFGRDELLRLYKFYISARGF